MAQVNFTVDTNPMAHKMDNVAIEVAAVGAAVTAMQAAVIESEEQASEEICKSIDSGFYMLMRSRLSQRIAQFASTMNSRVGSMMETASAIGHIHEQMVGDFNRIKARYVKLFDGLDRNLENRVRELDKEAMSLARKRNAFLTGQQCKDAPSALYLASDISKVALKASNARLKTKALSSIANLGEGARHVVSYGRMTRSVFESRDTAGSPFSYIPVVYTVTENLAAPNTFALQVIPPATVDPKTQAELAAGVRRNQDKLQGSNQQELMAVRTAFANKIAASNVDARVSSTMMGLFDASFFSSGQGAAAPYANAGGTQAMAPGAQGGDVR